MRLRDHVVRLIFGATYGAGCGGVVYWVGNAIRKACG